MNFYQHLTQEERYMIYQLKKQKFSIQKISDLIGRSPSTISREIKRNSGGRGYRYKQAESFSQHRCQHSHRVARIDQETLDLAMSYICMDWSPEQVSNYLRLEHMLSISTETIYKKIWQDKAAGGTLHCHLRQSRKKRRKRYGSGNNYRGHLKNRISIDDRPAIVDTRERIGDWEIDTIIGKRHKGALVTIVERKSRYTLITKVDSRDSGLVGAKSLNLLNPIKDYILTITGDNGKEFACHENIARNLDCSFYFAHPYSSWERGLNENTNGLIRQYVPKGTDFLPVNDKQINHIMTRLNSRPRKCLGYKTPENVFFSAIERFSPHGERKRKKRICTVALTN